MLPGFEKERKKMSRQFFKFIHSGQGLRYEENDEKNSGYIARCGSALFTDRL